MLQYALKEKLHALVLEKSDQVGGLWAKLPSWQDIQFRKEDWSVNGLAVSGVTQAEILENIQQMVHAYQLDSHLRLSHEVLGIEFVAPTWHVQTSQGLFFARNVVVATGLHNRPKVPPTPMKGFDGAIYHSSELEDVRLLKGKEVTVVGGGASGYDLLDLALLHGAKTIHWVYRGLRWMMPSSQPKDAKSFLREFALAQMIGKTTDDLNLATNQMLDAKYKYFGIEAIKPAAPFDYRTMSLIPGRPEMIKYFQRLQRYPGQIQRLDKEGVTVETQTGDIQNFASDIVLFGTGYSMDLSYLQLPEYSPLTTQNEIRHQCRSLMASKHYPHLYFLGQAMLDASGSTPLASAFMARTLARIIRKGNTIAGPTIRENVNHWDLLKILAREDNYHFPRGLWRIWYAGKALWYQWRKDASIWV